MLITPLAVLGIDLIVIVTPAVLLLGRGRRVRDVPVRTRAPSLSRTGTLPVDGLDGQRRARPGGLRRLGDDPLVVTPGVGDGRVDVAVRAEDRERLPTPFTGAGPAPAVAVVVPSDDRPRT